jgi:hypothetical protein
MLSGVKLLFYSYTSCLLALHPQRNCRSSHHGDSGRLLLRRLRQLNLLRMMTRPIVAASPVSVALFAEVDRPLHLCK